MTADYKKATPTKKFEKLEHADTETKISKNKDVLVVGNKISNVDYKLSSCCNPVLGDKIFGFITVATGIKIHRNNCPNANALYNRYPYRIIPAQWTEKEGKKYITRLRIVGNDQMGMINRISNLISNALGLNMRTFSIHSSEGKIFDCTIELFVKSTSQLDLAVNKLLKLKGIRKVNRLDGV